MTEELDQMLSEKKGYRCEGYGGSGVNNPIDVIEHEIMVGMNYYMINDVCKLLKINDCSDDDPSKLLKFVILPELKKQYPETYAIWLATKEGVERYCDGDVPLEVPIPDNAAVVSDLGDDGVLFLFKEEE